MLCVDSSRLCMSGLSLCDLCLCYSILGSQFFNKYLLTYLQRLLSLLLSHVLQVVGLFPGNLASDKSCILTNIYVLGNVSRRRCRYISMVQHDAVFINSDVPATRWLWTHHCWTSVYQLQVSRSHFVIRFVVKSWAFFDVYRGLYDTMSEMQTDAFRCGTDIPGYVCLLHPMLIKVR